MKLHFQKFLQFGLLTLMLLAVSGCRSAWTHYSNDNSNARYDLADCKVYARDIAYDTSPNIYEVKMLFGKARGTEKVVSRGLVKDYLRGCMNTRGYALAPRDAQFKPLNDDATIEARTYVQLDIEGSDEGKLLPLCDNGLFRVSRGSSLDSNVRIRLMGKRKGDVVEVKKWFPRDKPDSAFEGQSIVMSYKILQLYSVLVEDAGSRPPE